MKNSLLFLFILMAQIAYCQFEYIELPEHNRESYKILHVFEDGTIIASTELVFGLFLSQNLGETWEEINTGFFNNSNNQDYQFNMDPTGQYYISSKYWVYKINIVDLNISQLISAYPSEIEDFTFLSNGNLLIANKDSLNLYDESLEIVKSHSWQIKGINLIAGTNNINYVAYTSFGLEEILVFDNDLTSFTLTISNDNVHHNNPIYLSNDRLFLKNGYSDNGGATIISYSTPNNQFISQHYAKDNRVTLLVHNDVYISIDSGESFKLLDEITSNKIEKLFLHSNNGLIYIDNYSDKKFINSSKNNGLTYDKFSFTHGVEYSENLAVDNDGNILVTEGNFNWIDNNYHIYKPSTNEWIIKPFLCYSFIDGIPYSLSNGILAQGECISYDGGNSWEEYNEIILNDIVDKNDILYDLGFKIKKSSDFGQSWEFVFENNEAFFSGNPIKITGDGNLITRVGQFTDDILIYVFKNGSIKTLDFPGSLQSYTTAYSSGEVYFKLEIENQIQLYISLNGHNDFKQLSTPALLSNIFKIKVDILNQLYLYSEKEIFISRDKGNSWEDISPQHEDLIKINDVTLGRDLHLYINTIGTSVLKSGETLTQIEELELKEQISVHPNPAINEIQVTSSHPISEVKIYNTNMQLLLTSKESTIDVSTIESGIYICEAYDTNNLLGVQRIVILK